MSQRNRSTLVAVADENDRPTSFASTSAAASIPLVVRSAGKRRSSTGRASILANLKNNKSQNDGNDNVGAYSKVSMVAQDNTEDDASDLTTSQHELSQVEVQIQAPTSDFYQIEQDEDDEAGEDDDAITMVIEMSATQIMDDRHLLPRPSSTPQTDSRSSSTRPRYAAPLHSPQVLSSRRRASLAPTPSSSSQQQQRTPSHKPKAKGRVSSARKLIATPTETLYAAPRSPDSDTEDPLLLRGGEVTRGVGEGRPRPSPSVAPSSQGGRRSISARVPTPRKRSRSAREQDREKQIERETQEREANQREWWGDADLAPLGSGGVGSDAVDDTKEDEDEEWMRRGRAEQASAGTDWIDWDAAADSQQLFAADTHLNHYAPSESGSDINDEDDAAVEQFLCSPFASPSNPEISHQSTSLPPSNRRKDYEVPVSFSSPTVVDRTKRRPSSPAPRRARMRSSSSIGRTSSDGRQSSMDTVRGDAFQEMEHAGMQQAMQVGAGYEVVIKEEVYEDDGIDEEQQYASEDFQEGQYREQERHQQLDRDVSSDMPDDVDDESEQAEMEMKAIMQRIEDEHELESSQQRRISTTSLDQRYDGTGYVNTVLGSPAPGHHRLHSISPSHRNSSHASPPSALIQRRPSLNFDSPILPTPQVKRHRPRSQSHAQASPQCQREVSSSTSTSRGHLTTQFSYPTLPSIRISSSDPQSAARAAAILKVHHEYVEHGLDRSALQRDQKKRKSSICAVGDDEGLMMVDVQDADESARLKELLSTAEAEILSFVPTPSSLASFRSPAPSSRSASLARPPSPHAAQLSSRQSSSAPYALAPTNTSLPWSKSDWHRLESALVDETRSARSEGRSTTVDNVIRVLLEREGLGDQQCGGDWQSSKLSLKVQALMEQRSRDSQSRADERSRRATSSIAPSQIQHSRRATSSATERLDKVGLDTRGNSGIPLDEELSNATFFERRNEVVTSDEDDGACHEQEWEKEDDNTQEDVEDDDDTETEDGAPNDEEDTFFEHRRPVAVYNPSTHQPRQRSQLHLHTEAEDSFEISIKEENDDDLEDEEEWESEEQGGKEEERERNEDPRRSVPPLALSSQKFSHLYDDPIEKPGIPHEWRVKEQQQQQIAYEANHPSMASRVLTYFDTWRKPATSIDAWRDHLDVTSSDEEVKRGGLRRDDEVGDLSFASSSSSSTTEDQISSALRLPISSYARPVSALPARPVIPPTASPQHTPLSSAILTSLPSSSSSSTNQIFDPHHHLHIKANARYQAPSVSELVERRESLISPPNQYATRSMSKRKASER